MPELPRGGKEMLKKYDFSHRRLWGGDAGDGGRGLEAGSIRREMRNLGAALKKQGETDG